MYQTAILNGGMAIWDNATEFVRAGVPSYQHYIGIWTQGALKALNADEAAAIELLFNSGVERGDTFYAIKLVSEDWEPKEIFLVDNGMAGFTAMLPREY